MLSARTRSTFPPALVPSQSFDYGRAYTIIIVSLSLYFALASASVARSRARAFFAFITNVPRLGRSRLSRALRPIHHIPDVRQRRSIPRRRQASLRPQSCSRARPAVSPSRSRVDIASACPEPFPSSSRTFFRAMRHVPPARCVFIHRARFRAVRACARDAIVRRQSRCRVSLTAGVPLARDGDDAGRVAPARRRDGARGEGLAAVRTVRRCGDERARRRARRDVRRRAAMARRTEPTKILVPPTGTRGDLGNIGDLGVLYGNDARAR